MAEDISVTFALSKDLLGALGRAARDRGTSPSDYLRLLVDLALTGAPMRGGKDMAVRIALAEARDWPDLQKRLRKAGCVLRRAASADELMLCSWPHERPILPLPALGGSRAMLALRFGVDFPPGGQLSRRVADKPAGSFKSRRAA